MLYIWGHSYELDNKDYPVQWAQLEDTLKTLCEGQDNIWFATNIEIYDYVHAVSCLRRSADGMTVQNPTTIDIWVSCDDESALIPANSSVAF